MVSAVTQGKTPADTEIVRSAVHAHEQSAPIEALGRDQEPSFQIHSVDILLPEVVAVVA
jgi:hypothetical protein